VPEEIDRRRFLAAGTASIAAGALAPLPNRAASVAEASQVRSEVPRNDPGVDALTFDVFGTVVDWRGSIIREGELLGSSLGLAVDWPAFADAWRRGYGPAMDRVRTGELPWLTIDELHRMILDEILVEFGLSSLAEEQRLHLNRAWHRLLPWPDTVGGLNRLRTRFLLVTLSNGNVSLLANMARNAGLPWDVVLSAELAGHYKPDPEVYLTAADLLDLPPQRIMMVAAHKGDLRAAQAIGFKTAWVPRPLEWGVDPDADTAPDAQFDYSASDFLDLARQLGT
jgi:2-haloacid dehalogenase